MWDNDRVIKKLQQLNANQAKYIDEKDEKIRRLKKVGNEMLSYFTGAREGNCGDHVVKCDIQANVKFVDRWIQILKEE